MLEQVASIENLFTAWRKFCRGKRRKRDVQAFELQLEENLFELRLELLAGSYVHGAYRRFTVFDPKRRIIHKAAVRDRVVHQAVSNVLEPTIDPRLIFDSFSCRPGKGTHAAVDRLLHFLRRESSNSTRTVYVLKCDVQRFFASVDHAVLLRLFERHVPDVRLRALLERIVASFSTEPGKGIPLGNLTSQLFANVYLNELDRFAKHELRASSYVRYCDDFAFVSRSRVELEQLVPRINHFLLSELRLHLHPAKVLIRTWTQGIDFLGYVLKPDCVLVRTRTAERMLARINSRNATSYLGVCSHADSLELQTALRHLIWQR